MGERIDDKEERPDPNGDPIPELAGLEVDVHSHLADRVLRDINRRTLAADTLVFR